MQLTMQELDKQNEKNKTVEKVICDSQKELDDSIIPQNTEIPCKNFPSSSIPLPTDNADNRRKREQKISRLKKDVLSIYFNITKGNKRCSNVMWVKVYTKYFEMFPDNPVALSTFKRYTQK